jgi:hypothetical protein
VRSSTHALLAVVGHSSRRAPRRLWGALIRAALERCERLLQLLLADELSEPGADRPGRLLDRVAIANFSHTGSGATSRRNTLSLQAPLQKKGAALERDAGLPSSAAGRTTRGGSNGADDGVAVSELAQVGEVRECCGERYLLVEQQRGSFVRRWFARADYSEQWPLAACGRCATPLLPHAATQPAARRRGASYAGACTLEWSWGESARRW